MPERPKYRLMGVFMSRALFNTLPLAVAVGVTRKVFGVDN